MKKLISVILAALMLFSVICVPAFAQEETISDKEIARIFRTLGFCTWGSGYFGCDKANPDGTPATEAVAHLYIELADYLDDYTAEFPYTDEWGSYNLSGYEIPYTKYIEIIDSVFVNHTDMKAYLTDKSNNYYDEKTGMVSWLCAGLGGPCDWIVEEIYRKSDDLIYATGIMTEEDFEDGSLDGKKEHFEYITKFYGDNNEYSYKEKVCEPILLTLKKEDGKWKILEYRKNSFRIDGDKLYNYADEKVYNRLTIKSTGAVITEKKGSKNFWLSFDCNGSRWYVDGAEITFNVTAKNGQKISSVVLSDANGEREIKSKDNAYTITPEGAAVLKINTKKSSAGIVISKPEFKNVFKVSEKNAVVYAVAGKTVAELKDAVSAETEILKADGTKAKSTDKIASGMQIVIKDEDGAVADIKTVVVPGDVDGNAEISATDARSVLRASVKLDALNDWASAAANVDGNEQLSANDARNILRASVKLEDSSDWLAVLV